MSLQRLGRYRGQDSLAGAIPCLHARLGTKPDLLRMRCCHRKQACQWFRRSAYLLVPTRGHYGHTESFERSGRQICNEQTAVSASRVVRLACERNCEGTSDVPLLSAVPFEPPVKPAMA